MCRKKKPGGFADPEYEKWEIRFGLIALGILAIMFLVLLGRAFS